MLSVHLSGNQVPARSFQLGMQNHELVLGNPVALVSGKKLVTRNWLKLVIKSKRAYVFVCTTVPVHFYFGFP